MQKSSSKQPVWKYKVDVGVRIDNYQWKVLLMNVFQIQLILVAMKKSLFHSYIIDDNEQDACDSHAHMFHIFKNDLN